MNPIEIALRKHYPETEYQIYISQFLFDESIHSTQFSEDGLNLRLRHYSPSRKGDKAMLFYAVMD